MVTQFAIEPHAYMAAPDGDGIAVWSAIQHPYWLQRVIADLLGLPLAKVRVFAPDPGGAFGGKQHAKYEPLLAFIARATGRQVRLVLTLEETFQAVRRGASEVRVRSGFRRDGTLVFRDIEANYLIGAYADIADRTVAKGSYTSNGPYRVPNVRILARSVPLPHRALDRVPWLRQPAADLGGRVEHERGGARAGNRSARPAAAEPRGTRRDLHPARHAGRRRLGPGRGAGGGHDRLAKPDTSRTRAGHRRRAQVRPDDRPLLLDGPPLVDGSAVVYAGTSDMGQGARTIFAQIAAQELGAPLDWVTVVMGDTAVVPYDQQTSASRSSVLMGNAVLAACRDIHAKLRAMAAVLERVHESEVVVEDGKVRIGDRAMAIRDVVAQGLGRLGGEIIGVGESRKEAEPDHPLGGTSAFYEFNCTAVEASVDRDTGDITIHRYVTVSDVGKALNPSQVRGQDEGAAVMGLGHTLMEHYILDDTGRIRNLGAIDYRIPTSMDLPLRMESDMIENADGPGPYGAKGMSEGALLPVAPAVAAAVADATGVTIRDLPLSPERVWQALRESERS